MTRTGGSVGAGVAVVVVGSDAVAVVASVVDAAVEVAAVDSAITVWTGARVSSAARSRTMATTPGALRVRWIFRVKEPDF